MGNHALVAYIGHFPRGSLHAPTAKDLRQELCQCIFSGIEGGNYSPGGWLLLGEKPNKKPQRIVNVREKTGRYYFKGQPEQLGSDWDTDKDMVERKSD